MLQSINTSASLLVPSYVIRASVSTLSSGLCLILLSLTLFMKLISFAHVMHIDRKRIAKGLNPLFRNDGSISTSDRDKVQGDNNKSDESNASESNGDMTARRKKNDDLAEDDPHYDHSTDNDMEVHVLSIQHIMYFAAAPTLCYQHTYPRSPARIRLRYVARRVAELAFCIVLITVIIQQWMQPTITNAMRYMEGDMGSWHYGGVIERILKLSLPNLGLWLLIFFCLFHSWLNLLAELLRFGDRVFYRDWWNASTMKDYWNRWNAPVHNFVLRHVYAPCIRNGISSLHAQLLVFLLSAALHEVAVSVPLHSFKLWAFFGMLGQVPLVMLTEKLKNLVSNHHLWGNVFFWLTFCFFGQPVIILLYYHDAVRKSELISASIAQEVLQSSS